MGKFLFTVSGQSNAGLIYPQLKAALIEKYGADTRVILSAKGNTPIAEFSQGMPIYNNLLTQIISAQADGYTWAKHFYWQGEADTRPGLSELWGDAFVKMVVDLRNDTEAFPQIIFFKIGLPPNSENSDWYVLQDAQEQVRRTHPGFLLVPTSLPNYPTPDVPHRSERSYAILTSWVMALFP